MVATVPATLAGASETISHFLSERQRADLVAGLGQTDMTDAIQRAIDAPGPNGACVRLPPVNVWRIAGTILLPPNTTLDLSGGLVRGTGTNTLFETGMRVGGMTTSNKVATPETGIVFKTSVSNGSLANAGLGFHLFNFCESSTLRNLRMTGLRAAVYARRCFFASFRQLIARAGGRSDADIAFRFSDAVNAIDLSGLVSEGYRVGFWFDGSKSCPLIQNCSVENGQDGMVFLDSTEGVTIQGCYFENLHAMALRFDPDHPHDAVTVTGNWFQGCKTVINGPTVRSGTWHRDNVLGGGKVVLGGSTPPGIVVELPETIGDKDAGPAGAFILGDAVSAHGVRTVVNGTQVAVRARVQAGVIPHNYTGSSGAPPVGTVPFATHAAINSRPCCIVIDTQIAHTSCEMFGYALEITTRAGFTRVAGLVVGLTPLPIGTSTKIVTITENRGLIRLSVSPFEQAELPYQLTGTVRHL